MSEETRICSQPRTQETGDSVQPQTDEKNGCLRLLNIGCASMLFLTLTCCLIPYALIRVKCALHPPIKGAGDRIKNGMTREKVQKMYGQPHERSTDHKGREVWYYYCDCLGQWIVGVQFDEDGRVESSWW